MSEPTYLTTLYRMRDEYRANAELAIAAGEYRKASELLWGSVSQQLKAVAASRDIVISSHRQFFEFLRQFARELQAPSLYEDFVDLNALHKNFYDETIPADDFPRYYEKTIRYLGRLEEIITQAPPS